VLRLVYRDLRKEAEPFDVRKHRNW
jgi:hypothetical protein